MPKKKHKRRKSDFPVVVFLGAGASKDAGLPLSTDLTDILHARLVASGEDQLLNAFELIVRSGSAGSVRAAGRLDIESFIRIAETLAGRTDHCLARFVAGWTPELAGLDPVSDGLVFRRLVAEARRTMHEELKAPLKESKVGYLSAVNGLTKTIANFGNVLPVVFTLNYDKCLETALDLAGIKYTTGFDNRGEWDQRQFLRAEVLRVFKLHGSFGWIRHPEYLTIFQYEHAIRRDDMFVASPETADDIIFGTDVKLQALQPYLWMFQRCAEIASTAQYIVCVGYSFGDEHINLILRQALAGDSTKRLIVVSPSASEAGFRESKKLPYFAERIGFVRAGARRALTGGAILAKIRDYEGQIAEDTAFS